MMNHELTGSFKISRQPDPLGRSSTELCPSAFRARDLEEGQHGGQDVVEVLALK